MKAAKVFDFGSPRAPQVEDGYTRIANELFDAALAAHLPGSEFMVFMAIIRKTYGYNKKQDDVSASQIGDMCGIARNHVTTALKKLEAKQMIHKRAGTYGSVIGIQKDYSRWIVGGKKEVEQKAEKPTSPKIGLVQVLDGSSPKDGQVGSPKVGHTKDNLPKDNQQKTTRNAIALRTYLENCRTQNVKPIPADDAVFTYAKEAGIPEEYLRLQWLEFRDRFQLPGAKRYKSWSQAFGNSVRGNWYKLWYATADGSYGLTTAGQQAARKHGRSA